MVWSLIVAAQDVETPVLKVVVEVRELVTRLTGSFALEVPPGFDDN
jgi:hypothetical protein